MSETEGRRKLARTWTARRTRTRRAGKDMDSEKDKDEDS
jgi:hypothetical protein